MMKPVDVMLKTIEPRLVARAYMALKAHGVTPDQLMMARPIGGAHIITHGKKWRFDPRGQFAITVPVVFDQTYDAQQSGNLCDMIAFYPDQLKRVYAFFLQHGFVGDRMDLMTVSPLRFHRSFISLVLADYDGVYVYDADLAALSLKSYVFEAQAEGYAHALEVEQILEDPFLDEIHVSFPEGRA